MNSYLDNLHLQSKTVSDQMSLCQSGFDNYAVSNSSVAKKRNKQWRAEDELRLAELISKTQKDIQDLSDREWSEIAQKLDLTP